MDNIRAKLVAGVVILQMIFFAGWYINESNNNPIIEKASQIMGNPEPKVTQIMVKTMPSDPRDLISGQYIRLRYSFSNLNKFWYEQLQQESDNLKRKNVWVVLNEVNGFYEFKAAFNVKPTSIPVGDVLIKGTMRGPNVKYGIEKYFVPEGTPEPNRSALTVKLDVYENGKVRISQAFLGNKEWP